MRPNYTPEDIARFWSRVDPSGGPGSCWPFVGYHHARNGYPRVKMRGRAATASRVALIIASDDDPGPSICSCHTCDNRSCCNPAHLFWGTKRDNFEDMVGKGRRILGIRRGVNSSLGKLNADQVRSIRRQCAGGVSQRAVAAAFGITQGRVSDVVRRKSYQDVEEPHPGA